MSAYRVSQSFFRSYLLFGCVALALSGCDDSDSASSGSSSSGSSSAPTYSLTGTVSGLSSTGLALSVDNTSVVVSNGATSVALASGLSSGTAYTVSVATQPSGQTCSVAAGSGTIASANVANVVVTCSDQAFVLGGTISGLNGSGLVLANGTDTLPVASGVTSFVMPTQVAYTSSYAVTVKTQPSGLICSVAAGTGTMGSASVANVVVTCSDQAFALGGTISGLNGSGLVLANGTDTLSVTSGATSFSMPTHVAYTSSYAVTVQAQAGGLACSVVHGSGTMPAAPVTGVTVICTDQPFTVGGTIAGLGSHTGLVLINGSDVLNVAAGATSFAMPTAVAFGNAYAVQVQGSPAGLICSISNGAGTMGAGSVSGISVTCSDRAYTLGGTITGLNASGLVLANGTDTLSVASGASAFTMNTAVPYTASYNVQVQSNPIGETCTPTSNSGTMPASAVSNVALTCSANTYTIGGSIGSLTRSGLVLLDNGGDATHIAANASQFSMNTGVAYGASYDVTIGVQPYGINLACQPANNTGTASAMVTNVAVNCATATPVQTAIASWFSSPAGVAVDASGNVYVADYGNSAVKKIPFSNGVYGTPVTLGSGFSGPGGVAVDASGNVYVADSGNNAVKQIPLSNGVYGTPVTLGSGFNYPYGVAVDASGNVYVADDFNSAVKKVPLSNGVYGTPVTLGSGFSHPLGVAVDASGNVYVADTSNSAVKQIPLNNGVYGTPVTLGSGFSYPRGVAVDVVGNVYVADFNDNAVKQIPLSNGVYGTPVTLGSGFSNPSGVVVDAAGNVYVADTNNNAVKQIPLSNGVYGTPVTLGSGFSNPSGVAVDAAGNVYLADTFNNAVKEVPFSSGAYGTPVTLGSGFSYPANVAVDAQGRLYMLDRQALWMFTP